MSVNGTRDTYIAIMKAWAGRAALVASVLAFVVRVEIAARTSSATFDEPEYITSGYSYVATGRLRLEPWHPPLALWLAGLAVRVAVDPPFRPDAEAWRKAEPRTIARGFLYGDGNDADAILHAARLPSLLLGLATVALIGAWAAQLWGARAGGFALALATFDPNLIAHSAVATPDIAVTCFALAAMYATWRFARGPTPVWLLAACLAAVLAVASKHVAVVLAPLVALALVAAFVDADRARRRAIVRSLAIVLAGFVFAIAVAGLLGARVQAPGIMLWRGIFHQLGHAESPPPAFLHGHIAVGGWWYYYLDVCALKVPLGTLALVGLTLARLRPGNGAMRDAVVYLAAPVVVVIAAVAWTRIDLGIRLILPAVPFGLVLASRAAGFGERRWRYAAAGALAATLVSSAFATTNELSYFNEAARVLGGGERWLSDSNLDWGQDLDRLAGYLREHDAPPVYLAYFGGGSPTYLGIRHASLPTVVAYPPNADIVGDRDEPLAPCQAERELVAISTFRRQGVPELSPHRYEWLEAQTPLAELGQIRVYDVTSDLESHVQLATIYGIDSPTGLCERSRAIALDPRAAARFANRH